MDFSKTEKVLMELQPLLTDLSDKIGTTSAHFWSILIRQVYVEAVGELIGIAVFLTLSLIAKKMWVLVEKKEKVNEYLEILEAVRPICIIIWVISVIFIPACLYSLSARLINPEYYAIEMILKAVSK